MRIQIILNHPDLDGIRILGCHCLTKKSVFSFGELWMNLCYSFSVQQPLQGTVDKRGIIYRLPQGENHIPWEIVNRMRRNSLMVTLVIISGLMLVFPRHFFINEGDWNRFNALVEKKILPVR